jgi:hypothetical protein
VLKFLTSNAVGSKHIGLQTQQFESGIFSRDHAVNNNVASDIPTPGITPTAPLWMPQGSVQQCMYVPKFKRLRFASQYMLG